MFLTVCPPGGVSCLFRPASVLPAVPQSSHSLPLSSLTASDRGNLSLSLSLHRDPPSLIVRGVLSFLSASPLFVVWPSTLDFWVYVLEQKGFTHPAFVAFIPRIHSLLQCCPS